MTSPGKKLKDAIAAGAPLHMIGVGDGADALAAERAGFQAIYVSGSQVAASYGLADIGVIELKHVVEHVRRILDSGTKLPMLVDIDTGFDDVADVIRTLEAMSVAAVHMEDQQDLKACGHLPGKHVISEKDAADRISRAAAAKKDKDFCIMARSDALAVEGLAPTLARITAYVNAGADMIFPEAFDKNEDFERSKAAAQGRPILANMTEFGKTALRTPAEMTGIADIVMNPLTVYRGQRALAERMLKEMRKESDIVEISDGSDALEAQRAGFNKIYLSISQIAASHGWHDAGKVDKKIIRSHIDRILASGVKIPLLLNIDADFKGMNQAQAIGIPAFKAPARTGKAPTLYEAQRALAEHMYRDIKARGTQRGMEPALQTRESFQAFIDYKKQVSDRAALLAQTQKPSKTTPKP